MTEQTPKRIVEQFWMAMDENDFRAAGALLHDEYVIDYPQSGERLRRRENFIAVNENYPAKGRWRFTVDTSLADADVVVTIVVATDGVQTHHVITFSTIREGTIATQTEYWPDRFEPAPWHAQWVEPMPNAENITDMW